MCCSTPPVFGALVGMCYVMLCSFLSLNCFQDLSDNKEDAIPVIYYCAVSTLQNKHQGAITDIKWLPPAFTVRPRGWMGDSSPGQFPTHTDIA